MPDQADHLRHLIQGARRASHDGAAPQRIVVTGAKGGVGTTTVSVNLAVALARQGRRTVLVDGDLRKSGVAALCGDVPGTTIGGVLAGRRGIEELLRPGPAGVHLLASTWATGQLADCDPAYQERLIAGFDRLGDADVVVIDAGCTIHRIMQSFWRTANHVLLVLTPDDTAVMDAYAMLKTVAARHRHVPVSAVMNQIVRFGDARDVHARLAQACGRFLAIDIPCVANVMSSEEVSAAATRQAPFAIDAPVCQATQTMEHLAQFFAIEECFVGSGE